MVLVLLVRVLEGEAADLSVAVEVREHIDTAREEVTKQIWGIVAKLDQTGGQSLLLAEPCILQNLVQATGEADIQPHQHLLRVATPLHQFVYIQTGLIVTSCEIEEFLQASRWGRVDRLLQLHHFANGWGDCQFSQQEQTSSIRCLVGLTALDD